MCSLGFCLAKFCRFLFIFMQNRGVNAISAGFKSASGLLVPVVWLGVFRLRQGGAMMMMMMYAVRQTP
jgi:hypothetical protein